jgi:hypothetical protein
MQKLMLQEELDRIEVMTTIEAVAYANRLSRRLKSRECTDEEKRNGLILLEKLSDIAHLLKIA